LFFVLSVTWPKLPLSQILSHVMCDAYSLKAVETLIHGNIYTWTVIQILVSLLWLKYIFFWFYWSVGFKGNNKYAKKRYCVSHGMCWCCCFHFRYSAAQIYPNQNIRVIHVSPIRVYAYVYRHICIWIYVHTRIQYIRVCLISVYELSYCFFFS